MAHRRKNSILFGIDTIKHNEIPERTRYQNEYEFQTLSYIILMILDSGKLRRCNIKYAIQIRDRSGKKKGRKHDRTSVPREKGFRCEELGITGTEKKTKGRTWVGFGQQRGSDDGRSLGTFIKPQYLSPVRTRDALFFFPTARMCPHWSIQLFLHANPAGCQTVRVANEEI